jgi:hypothetical protein
VSSNYIGEMKSKPGLAYNYIDLLTLNGDDICSLGCLKTSEKPDFSISKVFLVHGFKTSITQILCLISCHLMSAADAMNEVEERDKVLERRRELNRQAAQKLRNRQKQKALCVKQVILSTVTVQNKLIMENIGILLTILVSVFCRQYCLGVFHVSIH